MNLIASKHIEQILTNLKKEIYSNTAILGNFNTSLTSMDRLSGQKINKETFALKDTLDQLDLIKMYIEHSTPKQQNTIFLSIPWTIFQERSQDRPQVSFNKFRNIEILSIFSVHNTMRLK